MCLCYFLILSDRTYKFVVFFPLSSCRLRRSIIPASSNKSRHLSTVSLRFIPAYFAILLTEGKHVLSFPAKAHNTAYINAQFEGRPRFDISWNSSSPTLPNPCFPICSPFHQHYIRSGKRRMVGCSAIRGGSECSSWAVFNPAMCRI